jgi:hypothetical protein
VGALAAAALPRGARKWGEKAIAVVTAYQAAQEGEAREAVEGVPGWGWGPVGSSWTREMSATRPRQPAQPSVATGTEEEVLEEPVAEAASAGGMPAMADWDRERAGEISQEPPAGAAQAGSAMAMADWDRGRAGEDWEEPRAGAAPAGARTVGANLDWG